MKLLSRKATCNSHGQDSSYFLGWQEYEKNPYDEVRNPTGIIQMGLAESQVCQQNFFSPFSTLLLPHMHVMVFFLGVKFRLSFFFYLIPSLLLLAALI